MAVLDLQPHLFADSTCRNNRMKCIFFWCRISVPLLECEHTFPPSSRGRSLKLCYTSWCAQSLLTWLRELLEKTIWLHMKNKEINVNYLLSLLSHSFEIDFESDLQNLWYGKHTYFRFRLCRVGKLLSVCFHLGDLCSFPSIKSVNVLITTESDPSPG